MPGPEALALLLRLQPPSSALGFANLGKELAHLALHGCGQVPAFGLSLLECQDLCVHDAELAGQGLLCSNGFGEVLLLLIEFSVVLMESLLWKHLELLEDCKLSPEALALLLRLQPPSSALGFANLGKELAHLALHGCGQVPAFGLSLLECQDLCVHDAELAGQGLLCSNGFGEVLLLLIEFSVVLMESLLWKHLELLEDCKLLSDSQGP
eukprot:UN0292